MNSLGYSQSGGGYYIIISSIVGQFLTYTPDSGGSFIPYAGPENLSLIGTNGIIKDMGKTIISSMRTFRKFQAVGPINLRTDGVVGHENFYLTGYLEIRPWGALDGPRIARYA
jgi:hypothetical protein